MQLYLYVTLSAAWDDLTSWKAYGRNHIGMSDHFHPSTAVPNLLQILLFLTPLTAVPDHWKAQVLVKAHKHTYIYNVTHYS